MDNHRNFENLFGGVFYLALNTLNTINCICNKSVKPCLRCIQLQYTIIYVYSIITQIIMNAIKGMLNVTGFHQIYIFPNASFK